MCCSKGTVQQLTEYIVYFILSHVLHNASEMFFRGPEFGINKLIIIIRCIHTKCKGDLQCLLTDWTFSELYNWLLLILFHVSVQYYFRVVHGRGPTVNYHIASTLTNWVSVTTRHLSTNHLTWTDFKTCSEWHFVNTRDLNELQS